MKKGEVTGSKVQALLSTHFACHYHSAHSGTSWDVGGNLIYCAVSSSGCQDSPQGNTKMGIREEGGGCENRAGLLPRPPLMNLSNRSLMSYWRQAVTQSLFRCANLWIVVTITWDTVKSIPSPMTSECFSVFKCHNRKIKCPKSSEQSTVAPHKTNLRLYCATQKYVDEGCEKHKERKFNHFSRIFHVHKRQSILCLP